MSQANAYGWGKPPGGGNFKKWTKPGDRVVGRIKEVQTGHTVDGADCPQLLVEDDDGSEITVCASQAVLWRLVYDAQPQVGQRVHIQYDGADESGGRTLKMFTVLIEDGSDN